MSISSYQLGATAYSSAYALTNPLPNGELSLFEYLTLATIAASAKFFEIDLANE